MTRSLSRVGFDSDFRHPSRTHFFLPAFPKGPDLKDFPVFNSNRGSPELLGDLKPLPLL